MALECKIIQLPPVTASYSFQPTAPTSPSDVELMGGQGVHERPHQVVRGEVEDEPERDGDGEGGQCLLEHGEQQEGQTQTLSDTEAGGAGEGDHRLEGRKGALSDGPGCGLRSPDTPAPPLVLSAAL